MFVRFAKDINALLFQLIQMVHVVLFWVWAGVPPTAGAGQYDTRFTKGDLCENIDRARVFFATWLISRVVLNVIFRCSYMLQEASTR